ncbi:ATP-dependent DNA helicase RecG [Yoonia tamlensis]|uniref:ATP-dependent DNA helicase RecG n=1 Tax=Yoonia tamlensis TaxID=390270 RepID=A0A1I6GAY4_9RHOB|nr:ATP-dependent DNA helicase RecG [Yoonia tamlensis]SFR39281.1 ATP-dependent DNA helicase RecG [Yoonia tamlensis]
MTGRPEVLFPLFGALTKLDGVGPKTVQILEGAGITKPRDLLFTLPLSGVDRHRRGSIREVVAPAVATVAVTIGEHYPPNPPKSRGRPYRVNVSDEQTAFQLVYFHVRGDYLQKLLPTGQKRVVSGKIEVFDSIAQMVHPDHVVTLDEAEEIPAFEPVYALHAGISQKLMYRATQAALAMTTPLPEWIDPALKSREKWPDWQAALARAHRPKSPTDLSPHDPARHRLAYDELLAHQLTLALARSVQRRAKGIKSQATGQLSAKVLAALPYMPTSAQTRAIAEICADLGSEFRMNRLLQGDVGSGKTLVALMALLAVVEAGGQGVMMAPTEILARQHLDGLQPLAATAGIRLEILTGRDKGQARAQKLASLENGDISILVGTHAVFQKDIVFNDLRLAIIDEQHRFGVSQRMELGAKGGFTDVLVMTATPIPRSLALAQYGDLDVSVLDEKPAGRSPVQTALVSTARMDEVVEKLQHAVTEGRQAYWVCPLVEESEIVDMTAAQERFKQLRARLGEGVVGLVHGQMPPAEKDAAMARFVAGETKVLVATTVIEVGVNVPNASIMVIERAESFGLAQLHQLRGRVGRGAAASTCLLLYQAPLSETGKRRLEILRETEDGFKISEEDLAMRGAGDVIGTAQSGLPRFRIADIERQSDLMAIAQSDARALINTDPKLETTRGKAARTLLWLMEQDKAIRLISVG